RLGEPGLGGGLAIRHRRLRALLIVHDEVEGKAGAVRPPGVRWVRAVADEVSWGAFGHDVRPLTPSRGSGGAAPRTPNAECGRRRSAVDPSSPAVSRLTTLRSRHPCPRSERR